MSKGYWIARARIHDPEAYKAYLAANGEAFKKYNGKFLVRNGNYEALMGEAWPRNVILEFKDYETAKACFNSPEYQAAVNARGTSADVEVFIIEGYEGAQPNE